MTVRQEKESKRQDDQKLDRRKQRRFEWAAEVRRLLDGDLAFFSRSICFIRNILNALRRFLCLLNGLRHRPEFRFDASIFPPVPRD